MSQPIEALAMYSVKASKRLKLPRKKAGRLQINDEVRLAGRRD